MKEIPLSHGLYAIVDDEDYAWLSQYKWHAHKENNTFYVRRRFKVNDKWMHMTMHREILGLTHKDGKIVDHKNRNPLDNRRENLRITTHSINMYNRKLPKNNKSGYRGVSKYNKQDRWRALVSINGKQKRCGIYTDIVDAAKAYDRVATEHWGNNAILNFPKNRQSL